jgi:hypothetical protein
LEFFFGVFAGYLIQKHPATRQQSRNVKSPLGSMSPRHYLSPKDHFHSGPRPRVDALIAFAAGPPWFFASSHHNCTNRAQRSCGQSYSANQLFCFLSHFKSQILPARAWPERQRRIGGLKFENSIARRVPENTKKARQPLRLAAAGAPV